MECYSRFIIPRFPPHRQKHYIPPKISFSTTDSAQFSHLTTSANNYLLDKLSAARDAREVARTSGTNAKLDRAWSRWQQFIQKIEIDGDDFLDKFYPTDRVRILGAFAQAVREREFSTTGNQDLASGTCEEAVDKVAETFRANRRRDPRYGLNNQKDDSLKLQFRGYANIDPPTKQQKALTPSFYRQLYHRSSTAKSTALALLCISAFFWACRSCEYSKASGERKTALCKIENIRFSQGTENSPTTTQN